MYLMHISPRKSGAFEFDEETKRHLSTSINTDRMHLQGRGKNMTKKSEAGQGGVFHNEGLPSNAGPAANGPPMSSGAI